MIDKVKVLYIAGGWRSGSTLLSHILAQIDGLFSVGEVMFMWEDNFIWNRLCGCMTPARECEVWQGVMDEAFGGIDLAHAEEMRRLRQKFIRTRYLPLLMMSARGRLLGSGYRKYLDNLEKVYWGMQSSTGCSVIVDSSKFPAYAYTLGMIPTIDLYVVHLVRDPRAVAYSWRRKKWNPDVERYLPLYSPTHSALAWDYMNFAVETILGRSSNRYLLLRYEDFVARPQEAIKRVLKLVQEEVSELPFVAEDEAVLTPSHMVAGNPGVYKQTGTVRLRLDQDWRAKMKPRDRNLATVLTFPLARRYGYLG